MKIYQLRCAMPELIADSSERDVIQNVLEPSALFFSLEAAKAEALKECKEDFEDADLDSSGVAMEWVTSEAGVWMCSFTDGSEPRCYEIQATEVTGD